MAEAPPRAGAAARQCGSATEYFDGTPLADREGWYGDHLRALGERPLCAGPGAPAEVYRLTWLPSFHSSVVVRVEREAATYRLTAKTESGAGGYDPGHLARDTSFTLGEPDVTEFERRLAAAHFWTLSTDPPKTAMGLDGSQWVLEGITSGRYHVVDRWSPNVHGPDAQYRELAEWMLARSTLAQAEVVRMY